MAEEVSKEDRDKVFKRLKSQASNKVRSDRENLAFSLRRRRLSFSPAAARAQGSLVKMRIGARGCAVDQTGRERERKRKRKRKRENERDCERL